jgi:hypothetical protein
MIMSPSMVLKAFYQVVVPASGPRSWALNELSIVPRKVCHCPLHGRVLVEVDRVGAVRLAVEVTFAVAAPRRRLVRAILGAEALHRRPSRNLRAVDRKVLVR